MTRERRIEEGRRRAAAAAPVKATKRRDDAVERARRLGALSPEELRRRARQVSREATEAMGPDKTPSEWATAQQAIRAFAIEAARRRRTIGYDEIRLVAHEATGFWLGHSLFGRICMEINRSSDGCLLSSIIVRRDTGRPGKGFEEFAASQGFLDPAPTLQRNVFDHFGGSD